MGNFNKEPLDVGIQFLNVPKDTSVNIIKVVGVGGGGCNAVRNMFLEGINNVTFAVMNTDSQQLTKSPVPVKLLLGENGLGAGGRPEIGLKEAQNTAEQIRSLLSDGTKMVFVTASMGGGTGTGAAPFVAQIAKEMGLLTIGIVTIPFAFEGRRKIIKALQGVEAMRRNVDALLIINNESLGRGDENNEPVPMKDEYKRADNILKDAAKSISELITIHSDGDINLDFCDVDTTMRNGGGAIMAMGMASGQQRVARAILNALNSPLLYGNDIDRAKRILFAIYASDEAPLYNYEMREVQEFMDRLDIDIDLIWGTSTDNTLGQDVKVIILATGIEDELHGISSKQVAEKDNDYYLQLMAELYPARKRIQAEATSEATEETPTETDDNVDESLTEIEIPSESEPETQAGAEAGIPVEIEASAADSPEQTVGTDAAPTGAEETGEAETSSTTSGSPDSSSTKKSSNSGVYISRFITKIKEIWSFLEDLTNPYERDGGGR
jgi:cell division protein FtsZ